MMDPDPFVLNSNKFFSPQSSLNLYTMFVEETTFTSLCFMLYILDKQYIFYNYV